MIKSYSRLIILFLLAFFITQPAFATHSLVTIDKPQLIEKIKAHDGKSVVVFWAPWCPWCKKEIEEFSANKEYFEQNNLQVILLSPPKDNAKSLRYLRYKQIPFKAFARAESLKKDYRITSIPVTITYSNDGRILEMARGAKSMADLEYMLEDY